MKSIVPPLAVPQHNLSILTSDTLLPQHEDWTFSIGGKLGSTSTICAHAMRESTSEFLYNNIFRTYNISDQPLMRQMPLMISSRCRSAFRVFLFPMPLTLRVSLIRPLASYHTMPCHAVPCHTTHSPTRCAVWKHPYMAIVIAISIAQITHPPPGLISCLVFQPPKSPTCQKSS